LSFFILNKDKAEQFRPAFIPNPDKPERIATKAPRHKEKMIIIKNFVLGVLVAKILC